MESCIFYEDLLNVPFKINGRDPATGLDCYGLVLICCQRFGRPLIDFIAEAETTAKAEDWNEYAQRINIELIDRPEPGAIAQFIDRENTLHLVFYLNKDTVLQMTYRGVRVTPAVLVQNQHDYILMRTTKENGSTTL